MSDQSSCSENEEIRKKPSKVKIQYEVSANYSDSQDNQSYNQTGKVKTSDSGANYRVPPHKKSGEYKAKDRKNNESWRKNKV